MLGYWSDDCVTEEYTPDRRNRSTTGAGSRRARDYVEDHLTACQWWCSPAWVGSGRPSARHRTSSSTSSSSSAVTRRRGRCSSATTCCSRSPFAGLVVMRRRRMPIFPMLAIVVAITLTVVIGFPVTRDRAPFDTVRRSARRGRARRAVASLARRRASGRPDAAPGETPLPTAPPCRRGARMTTTTASTPRRASPPPPPPPDAPPARTTRSARHFVTGLVAVSAVGLSIRVMNVFWWRPTTDRPGTSGTGSGATRSTTTTRRTSSPTASSSSTPSATSSTGSKWRAPATRRSTRPISRCGRSSGIDGVTAHRLASGLLGVASIVVVGLRRPQGRRGGRRLDRGRRARGLPVHVDQRRHAACRSRSSCW